MGAWIETPVYLLVMITGCVAPYVGAWIETNNEIIELLNTRSHPMWVRGLKQYETGNRFLFYSNLSKSLILCRKTIRIIYC